MAGLILHNGCVLLPVGDRLVTHLRRAALHCAARRTGILRAVLAGLSVLVLASCSGGAIGASTPLSSGTSFVSGSYSSVYYATGHRPLAP